jgi:hypothetical protein
MWQSIDRRFCCQAPARPPRHQSSGIYRAAAGPLGHGLREALDRSPVRK